MSYYPGYSAARQKVPTLTREELVNTIESLYGWSWGEDGIDEEDADAVSRDRLREEVQRQEEEEWRIPEGQKHHYPDAEGD